MIDFENKKVFKLSKGNEKKIPDDIHDLLIPQEEIIGYYTALRDYVVFTSKRIIACNVQGVTGTKKDFSSLPYSRIQAFSVETAGALDIDAELSVYISGLGQVRFEFSGAGKIKEISQAMAEYIL